jgi:hypothetical protein
MESITPIGVLPGREWIKLQQHSERNTNHEYEQGSLAGYLKDAVSTSKNKYYDLGYHLQNCTESSQ